MGRAGSWYAGARVQSHLAIGILSEPAQACYSVVIVYCAAYLLPSELHRCSHPYVAVGYYACSVRIMFNIS